ncbi:hypothetical protein IDG58_05045 [Pelagibacterales bacterium SAG-MED19]|nr:hypothetical protein [Pelagibacterales bacterium SAG-MED19]
MSSEVHKYKEESLNKNENLFNAKVINFPNDKNFDETQNLKTNTYSVWKISDESNDDQLKAVIGLCFMFGALIVIGLYSNFL